MNRQERLHYVLNQTEYVTMFMSMHDEEVKARKVREFLEQGRADKQLALESTLWNDRELFILTSMILALGVIIGKVL